jgi:small conductance mechanosensitive channel
MGDYMQEKKKAPSKKKVRVQEKLIEIQTKEAKSRRRKRAFRKIRAWGLAIIGIAFVILILFSKNIFGKDLLNNGEENTYISSIGDGFCKTTTSWIHTGLTIILTLLAIFLLKVIRKGVGMTNKKVATFISISFSLLKWIIIIVALIRILMVWGVDVLTILAGLGIVALIIGLGCQSLISDIVAGIFLVVDNAFEVGDIVLIDGFRGKVKEIGLKSTKIEDVGGNVKLIQNSDIATVVNLTNSYSVAVNEIGIGYNENIKKVEALVSENMDEIVYGIHGIIKGPFYKGVSSMSDSSVILRFVTTCLEEDRFQIERELNRNFLVFLHDHDITIPFSQVTVNKPDPNHLKTTKTAEKKSEEFLDGQRKESLGIEEN